MTIEENARLIERVRKLYAMSQDSSSPREAEIAARRARSLMDTHGITLESLDTSEFGTAQATNTYKAMPSWYGVLSLGVAVFNDCKVIRKQDDTNGIASIEFQGYDVDVQSCSLMLDYLTGTMERSLANAKDEHLDSSRGFASSFRRGFASDMQSRLFAMTETREQEAAEAIESESGTSLIVIKKQLVEKKFGVTRIRSGRSFRVASNGGYSAGVRASQRTGLNSQVGQSSRAALR